MMFRIIVAATMLAAATPTVARQAADPDWAMAGTAEAGMSGDVLAAMDAAIRKGDFQQVTSVLVARQGKLVHETYFDAPGRDALRNTRSVTKTVTALLVGAAIDRRLLGGVQEHVFGWFPDKHPVANPDPRKDAITVEDLLTMSSILECDDDNQFALDLPVRGFPAWAARPEKSPYGRAWSYCTAGSTLLGAMLGKVVKRPLDAFAREVLFDPLGIGKVEWQYAPEGFAMGGGGLGLRSRDLLKLGQLLLNRGAWNGRPVLSKAWAEAMLAPHVDLPDGRGDYGYQIWFQKLNAGGKAIPAVLMNGSGGNKVMIVPTLDLVAVVTTTNFGVRNPHAITEKLLTEHVLAATL